MNKRTARISNFNAERGFGFLVEPDNSRYFFHVSNCENFIPQINMIVEFEPGVNAKGKAAYHISLVDSSAVGSIANPVQTLLDAIKGAR